MSTPRHFISDLEGLVTSLKGYAKTFRASALLLEIDAEDPLFAIVPKMVRETHDTLDLWREGSPAYNATELLLEEEEPNAESQLREARNEIQKLSKENHRMKQALQVYRGRDEALGGRLLTCPQCGKRGRHTDTKDRCHLCGHWDKPF